MNWAIVVPWFRQEQKELFLDAWKADKADQRLVLQHDSNKEGCGRTKNKGVAEALRRGAEVVVVLDDDCFPVDETWDLPRLALAHGGALAEVEVAMFQAVTEPPSRGTPYQATTLTMPVAASMGFWTEIGDYCAVRQLAFNKRPMELRHEPVAYRYFPLCGMNLAFRPRDWLPWCRFIEVPRYDDIWMGWLWQREAYSRGHCFNLGGPVVRHSRQSNVWQNLRLEAEHAEESDVLWRRIASSHKREYEALRMLLPEPWCRD